MIFGYKRNSKRLYDVIELSYGIWYHYRQWLT